LLYNRFAEKIFKLTFYWSVILVHKPMYEVRIVPEKTQICEFCEQTISVTPLHNWHKDLELIFVTNGSGYINYNTKKLPITQGDIVVINSEVMHRTYCDADNKITYHYLIVFDSFCREIGIDVSDFMFEEKIQNEIMWKMYLEILDINANVQNMLPQIYNLKLRKAITTLMIELFEKHQTKEETEIYSNTSSTMHLKEAIKYINENFMKHITLEDIAKHSSICKYHLSKEFKKYTGQTVFEYVNAVRCRNANTFILSGLSISEAAYRCGFENMSYFSKTFKKYVGELPSKVGRNNKNTAINSD